MASPPARPAAAAGAPKYNPITHLGEVGVPEPQRAKGIRLAAQTPSTAGHLAGAACIPLPGSDGSAAGGGGPAAAAGMHGLCRARVDHLDGGACFPARGDPRDRCVPPQLAGEAINLRASVDHLGGSACVVRDVGVVQATREVEAPPASRGMLTEHIKQKMAARTMNEATWGSMVF